jgi:predicted nucleotidyltransferase
VLLCKTNMRSHEALLDQAAAVAHVAVDTIPEVEAVLVFGSVARSSADTSSDVDVLLVTSGRVRVSELIAQLRPHCDLASVGLSTKSWARLAQLRKTRSLFFRHLQVEGKILEDDSRRLAELLAPPVITVDVDSHRSSLARSLALYKDVDRLGDFHLFALAHIYVLGKRAAQLCLQEVGRDVYDPELVFRETATLHPEMARELDMIRRLRPLYSVVRGSRREPGSEDPSAYSASVDVARTVVERLLHK